MGRGGEDEVPAEVEERGVQFEMAKKKKKKHMKLDKRCAYGRKVRQSDLQSRGSAPSPIAHDQPPQRRPPPPSHGTAELSAWRAAQRLNYCPGPSYQCESRR